MPGKGHVGRKFTLPLGRSRAESRALARVRLAFAGSPLEKAMENAARAGIPPKRVIADLTDLARKHTRETETYRRGKYLEYPMLERGEWPQPHEIPESRVGEPWWMKKIGPLKVMPRAERIANAKKDMKEWKWTNITRRNEVAKIHAELTSRGEAASSYHKAVELFGKERVDKQIQFLFVGAKQIGHVVTASNISEALGKLYREIDTKRRAAERSREEEEERRLAAEVSRSEARRMIEG
ncbi:hypothetical protein HYS54_03920 [Candidatus Micrarchaeota archaeon]|nr:hypothetical protein [Candidatus Micrarchaeota archaeon]